MNRFGILILTFLLALFLSGCGKETPTEPKKQVEPVEQPEVLPPSDSTDAPAPVDTLVPPDTVIIPKIGEFYAGGIVFAVGEDYAKVFSIDEAVCFWAQESVSKVRVGTDANPDEGYANTVMFKERADMAFFEAAAWCIVKGDDWYLPSRAELNAIANALKLTTAEGLDTLNAHLLKAGGQVLQKAYYWTSCEHATDSTKAWTVRMDTKTPGAYAKKGNSGRPVRAVKKVYFANPGGDDDEEPFVEGNEYDVFLLIGQSNMAGRGTLIEGDTDPFDQNVYLLNAVGLPEPATNPLNQYSTVRKTTTAQGMNPGFSFSKKISQQTGRKILLVVNARGGTSLSEWKPNSSTGYYKEAVARTKLARKYGHVVAILWHQGESNSSNPSGYLDGLKTIVDALRPDVGNSNAPFIAGEIAEWHTNASKFNPVIQQISSVISNSDYVSSKDCGMLKDTSDPHFSRDGQILLGERYADKVLQYCYAN